jgi:hypothetical protein
MLIQQRRFRAVGDVTTYRRTKAFDVAVQFLLALEMWSWFLHFLCAGLSPNDNSSAVHRMFVFSLISVCRVLFSHIFLLP